MHGGVQADAADPSEQASILEAFFAAIGQDMSELERQQLLTTRKNAEGVVSVADFQQLCVELKEKHGDHEGVDAHHDDAVAAHEQRKIGHRP